MLDSSNAHRIASSIEELSRQVTRLRNEVCGLGHEVGRLGHEVCGLGHELSGLRKKSGPQPEWLLFMFAVAMMVLSVGLLIVDYAKKDRKPNRESPHIEAPRELPEKSP
jgi:hypothetical protein